MLRSLAHRGPDDHHVTAATRAIIGARRLAIIDLDTGRQPIANEDGGILASQNGEIYNYVELRHELTATGHVMKTAGDTEILVHAYEEFGTRFPERLRGMFAAALWDEKRQRLVLVRDRLGKKPLYWRLENGRMSYGSELKALLADPATSMEIDQEGLALYLQYQYIPSPKTIFKNVYKLPPASILIWEGGNPHISRYWTPEFVPKAPTASGARLDECLAILRESVRLRLRSDVPVGMFLSGGMDSSVVTALMVEASERTVRTYSIGFEEQSHNELPYARAVAEHLETDHVEDIVTVDAVSLLPKLAYHFDEPFGDPSALPTYRIAELAGNDLKVVLTGDGGDETFGGYERYLRHELSGRLARISGSRLLTTTLDALVSHSPASTTSEATRSLVAKARPDG